MPVHASSRLVLALFALSLALAAPASASGPDLTVPRADLRAAYNCPIDGTYSTKTPVMFVTGTGVSGDLAYGFGRPAFEAAGHPVCYMNYPDNTTADIQVSVQYLVYGLRRQFEAFGGRKVAVIGISQGGLLPRFALTYWPDLRRKVSDVLAAAGTQHGTTVFRGCSASSPCTPASWQQGSRSNLLRAINSQKDETPGDVSYTTVRTLTDETVQPTGGKRPTSALKGARNIVIQDVCPGRKTTHIGTAVDSVTFAAFRVALRRGGKGIKGAARVSGLPRDVCQRPYAPGLDETQTGAILDGLSSGGLGDAANPVVAREPKVRRIFKRIAP